MPVYQGFPPWPPSLPEEWPQYAGGAPGTLFLGPSAPVPLNAGGPGNTIIPGWASVNQFAEWVTEEPPPQPEPEPEPDGTS